MSSRLNGRKLLAHAVAFFVHFAHGGLMTAGVLVTIVTAAYLSGALGPMNPQAASGARGELIELAAAQPEEDRLGIQAMTDYLARRYRVAESAMEPLVGAAHLAGSRFGLDPLLIIAVIAIESSFNPIAESPMGARGLMQVIPRYHPEKLGDAGEAALLDPISNIHIGAQVLHESISRAGGLVAGLQQYGGAVSDAQSQYATKVIAEKRRLEAVVRQAVQAVRRTPTQA